MRPVAPRIEGAEERTLAENQPEYMPITIAVLAHELGLHLVSRWTFTPQERERIAKGADIYVGQLNFGGKFTPLTVGLRENVTLDPEQ